MINFPKLPKAWPAEAQEALWTALALVLFLEIVKDAAKIVPLAATILFTAAAIAQLYYPLWRVEQQGLDGRALGLDASHWPKDVGFALLLCVLTFGPFSVGNYFFWTKVFHAHVHWPPYFRDMKPISLLGVALPKELFFVNLVATHFIGVALPEEVFYRGFVQPRLAKAFSRRVRIFGADCGWEIPITSAIFALGHFAGEYDPLRLGPFFPGLLFGWLRARTGTVYGAITYHALSNLFSEFLFACYH